MPKTTVIEDNADFASLKSLAETCLDNYPLPFEKIQERSKKPDFTILFSLEGKKKTGFIAGYGEEGKMHIWLLGVASQKRGKGVGKALIKKFEQTASKKGYKAVNTITFNKYKGKIILSVREGYKIAATKFIPEKNDTAIIFEKNLGE